MPQAQSQLGVLFRMHVMFLRDVYFFSPENEFHLRGMKARGLYRVH